MGTNNKHRKPAENKAVKKQLRARLAPVKQEHKSVAKARRERTILHVAISLGGAIVVLIAVLILTATVLWVTDVWHKNPQETPQIAALAEEATVQPSVLEPVLVVETEVKSGFLDPEDPENQQRFDELRVFWEEVLSFMVQDQILKGRVSVPSISQRILGLQDKIIRRYGKPHDIDVILNYSETGNRKVQAESGVRKDKTPIMMIQVAAIEDFYNELQASGAPFVQQMFFIEVPLKPLYAKTIILRLTRR
ncbi:MAG: hypothetical protein IIB46_07195 [Nitrospinae bacterium]|nr:hypothetical protein [Nitrospinota bacterium]